MLKTRRKMVFHKQDGVSIDRLKARSALRYRVQETSSSRNLCQPRHCALPASVLVSERLYYRYLVNVRERSGERATELREQSSGVILGKAHRIDSAA